MSGPSSHRTVGGAGLAGAAEALAAGVQLVVGRYRVELDSGRTWWSDEVYRMHGREPGEIEPSMEALRSRTHPDDRGRVSRTAVVALRAGRPFSSAHRIVDPHGKARTVVVTGQAHVGDDGEITHVAGYVLDVSPVTREALDRESQRAVGRAMVSAAAVEQAKGAFMVVHGMAEAEAGDKVGEVAARAGIPLQSAAAQIVAGMAGAEGSPAQRLAAALDAVHTEDRPRGHEAQLARRRQRSRG
ncbi:PAS domain-containing protein [Isoptericola sp. CG 20/1183]|uniref:histidine kinase n=1 Tax=Isoptericola halotolerans TaxID=300560 RepID=A0ABX5E9S5_9MICO|nr:MULTISPECIES: PAS and ANTAR domain-containing protein [Isoptericola]PRZ03095.1 PAS domain-containing protein [Isoptericola sp. CG 20/1183]PRZ03349.1 PAS domain-containing protein [Isoptericola halotolerans]